jgi:uncharacterized protein (DUF58 family)
VIWNLGSIFFHGAGLFLLPFLIGFIAALFLETGEVGDTLPYLIGVSVLVIAPAWAMQAVGIVLKSSREIRSLRQKKHYQSGDFLRVVARHTRIVTPRGWAVLGSGLLFVVCSLGLKWADLSFVGVLSLLLFYGVLGTTSFISTFLVAAFESNLKRGTITRQVVPAVIPTGEAAEERFTFKKILVPPGYFLLVEEPLNPRLATVSRYAVGSGARKELTVGGRLRRSPRGLYRLGPAEIYYQDVFGFTRIAVASVATADLKVLPRFRPLKIQDPPRSRLETPDILTRLHRFATEDFFRFREYAPSDDTRRIQWKLSVKAGRLNVRLPENREFSTKNVLLVLDTFLPPGRMLEDAVGIEEVLDGMVETWISLAKELVERGDKVALASAARNQEGVLQAELMPCTKGGQLKWQDLGARVCWQGQFELDGLLKELAGDTHAVVVSSRFLTLPPCPQNGQSFTWVYLPPHQALGDKDPGLLESLAGSTLNAVLFLFRLPAPAGSDENSLAAQFRSFRYHTKRLSARARLRTVARVYGDRIYRELVERGDTVYRLETGPASHSLIGVVAGKGGIK